ncbi:MAG: hypothetical protein AAF944_13375 [Bacteroidota bacterium]
MKMFNAKDTKKTSKKKTWIFMLLIGIFSVATISCDDDDNDDNNTVTPEPEEEEVEEAWITNFVVSTPGGGVHYLYASEEVPENFDDPSIGVEIGQQKRVYSFEDKVYVYDNNAKTVTKWGVDRTDLTFAVEGIMSLASIGFNTLAFFPAFISETEAYATNFREGLVVEWNPSEMTLTEVYNVPVLESVQENASAGEFFNYILGNKIIAAVLQSAPSICCDINTEAMALKVGVFDVETKTFEYKTDDRVISANVRAFPDGNGNIYIQPDTDNSFIKEYFGLTSDDPSPHTILRIDSNGDFDPNFELNLDELLNVEEFLEASFVQENKIILSYVDGNDGLYPESFDDRRDLSRFTPARTVAIDLTTREVTPFDALEKYDFVIPYNIIDGLNYYICFARNEAGDFISFIVRQDSFDSFTELGDYGTSGAQWVGKLWGD